MRTLPRMALTMIGLAACCCGAKACCAMTPSGVPVQFTHQVNAIVWNARTHEEHFIRNAFFKTDSQNLAFIAPTPAVPEVASVDPEFIQQLVSDRLNAVHQLEHPGTLGVAAIPNSVEVMQALDVGGYHITTLKASGETPLVGWLKDHKFPMSLEVSDWIKPYVAKSWFFTVFQVPTTASQGKTGAIRLSFKTDKPFNPYFVPKSNFPSDADRAGLELYFISDQSYEGKIGGIKTWIQPDVIFNTYKGDVEKNIKHATEGARDQLVVTYFNDKSFPRPGADDLFFTPSPNLHGRIEDDLAKQAERKAHRDQIVQSVQIFGVVVAVVVFAGITLKAFRQRRS